MNSTYVNKRIELDPIIQAAKLFKIPLGSHKNFRKVLLGYYGLPNGGIFSYTVKLGPIGMDMRRHVKIINRKPRAKNVKNP
jgi:hypothetical protein